MKHLTTTIVHKTYALDPGVKPSFSGIPGMALVKNLAGSGLGLCLIILVLLTAASAVAWAAGSFSQASHVASKGKMGTLICFAASIVVAGANALVGGFSGLANDI